MTTVCTLHAPHADATQRDHALRIRATRPMTDADHLLARERRALAELEAAREAVGKHLAKQRHARRLTVKEAAKYAGVRPTEVGQVEHFQQYKKVNWRADVADRLAVTYARIAEHPLGPENSTTDS